MNVKKRLILYLPYLVIGLYAGKLPQAWRMAAGVNASEKLLNIWAAWNWRLPPHCPASICRIC